MNIPDWIYISWSWESLCRKAWRSVKCILIGYFTASDQASNFSFFYFLNSKNFKDKKAFEIWSEGPSWNVIFERPIDIFIHGKKFFLVLHPHNFECVGFYRSFWSTLIRLVFLTMLKNTLIHFQKSIFNWTKDLDQSAHGS